MLLWLLIENSFCLVFGGGRFFFMLFGFSGWWLLDVVFIWVNCVNCRYNLEFLLKIIKLNVKLLYM